MTVLALMVEVVQRRDFAALDDKGGVPIVLELLYEEIVLGFKALSKHDKVL